MSEEKNNAYTVYATTDYVDEQLNSASSSKLISHVLPIEATEENQTIFPINLETFDAANDTVLVQDGITLLLPNSGFTIENNTIVMTTPWGLGDTGSILILKNTPVLEDEVTISGAIIENNSITLDKLSADITTELDEIKKSASDGKALVAGAITDKGIETAADATFETMANNIDSITTIESASANMTATAGDMLADKTAIVAGKVVVGTIPSKAAATITPGTSNQIIAAGQYLAGDQTVKGDANLVAANIAKGKNIFGVTGTYDPGAFPGYTLETEAIYPGSDGRSTRSCTSYFPVGFEYTGNNASGWEYWYFEMTASYWEAYGYQNWGNVTWAKAKQYSLSVPAKTYTEIPGDAILPLFDYQTNRFFGCSPVKYVNAGCTYNGTMYYVYKKDGKYYIYYTYAVTVLYYLPS